MSETRFCSMEMEALMVDDSVRKRDGFRRWGYTYESLEEFASPEPRAFENQKAGPALGIYLRWVLPRELRSQNEDGEFPLIPNRWLITRNCHGHEPISWVLEGDCPLSKSLEPSLYSRMLSSVSQYYVTEEVMRQWKGGRDPVRKRPSAEPMSDCGYVVRLGIAFPSECWEEKAPDTMFLTACAPGNPMFSAYMPLNSGILSFYDSLDGISAGKLDYSVIGWYSNRKQDMFYSGQVFNIPWNRSGTDEHEYCDHLMELYRSRKIQVAVGESSEETLRTYIRSRLAGQMDVRALDSADHTLAALFHHMPDYKTSAGGIQKLNHQIHDNKFKRKRGAGDILSRRKRTGKWS